MTFFTKNITFLTLLLSTFSMLGQNTAKTAGDWETDGNWSTGTHPDHNQTNNTDVLIIDIAGGTPGLITVNDDFFLKGGTDLTVKGCDTLIITGNATFANNSVLDVEPCAVLINKGNLLNNNNSDQINIDGALTVEGDFSGGNGSVISGAGTTDVIGTITLDGDGTITTSVLPIELLQFSAIFNKDQVDIFWSTASEINNEKFIIERSKDGFEWQEIISVSGAGNSSSIQEYYEIDQEPLSGVSYYRLTQIDFDGRSETFNVVPVENISGGMIAFNIFPNPTTQDNLNLTFQGFENQEILVVVRDIQGKEHYSKVTMVSAENEIQLFSVDNKLPKGMYLITASSMNQLYSQKVIIK